MHVIVLLESEIIGLPLFVYVSSVVSLHNIVLWVGCFNFYLNQKSGLVMEGKPIKLAYCKMFQSIL